MIRAVFALTLLVIVTPPLMALQWIAVKLSLRLADRLPMVFHRMVCRLIGVRITMEGAPARERPLLLVANHASWLDIPVISALAPVSFVAKSEIARWPLFGTFARLQRCVFVERERRARTGAAADEMAERLKGGLAVVLFAEGTASDGNRVLPFRTALLGAAVRAASEDAALVQPLAIAYRGRHGLPLSRAERAHVAWYGKMDLPSHLWGVFSGPPLDVVVRFGAPVRLAAKTERKRVAGALEVSVRAMFAESMRGRPPSPAPQRALQEAVQEPEKRLSTGT
jgi:1-acyl-sn-glycerol-3-phosphate acyltransferase